ncbi:50S ribosomal protein L18 [Candidatus Woesearchaeota archaeon]|nr:50S ribosomal protein L18 [Candidatus Woesearchaeota archaeon]
MKTIQFKRKRKGKTDYKKRIQLLSSYACRVVVRKTNKHIITQAVNFTPKGDAVILTITTKDLQKLGWKGNTKNISASYLCGLLFGKKLKEKGTKKAIADLGMHTTVKGAKIFAVLKGVKDAGIDLPIGSTVVPSEDRIKGKHIENWSEKAKEHDKNQFQSYKKSNLDPKTLSKHFEEIKNKILK